MSQREAQVSAAGVGLFLTPEELRTLGINPDETDSISYIVRDGRIRVAQPAAKVED